jgi:hypothetical protein
MFEAAPSPEEHTLTLDVTAHADQLQREAFAEAVIIAVGARSEFATVLRQFVFTRSECLMCGGRIVPSPYASTDVRVRGVLGTLCSQLCVERLMVEVTRNEQNERRSK